MACTGWVSSSNGAFLEMTFQNIAAREGIGAEDAHVWTITGICDSMISRTAFV